MFEFVEKIGKWRVLVQARDIAYGAIKTSHIEDMSVTMDKLGDGAVTWEKMSREMQTIIASRQEGGVALSNDWGDSELLGITQKKLTEAHVAMTNQMEEEHRQQEERSEQLQVQIDSLNAESDIDEANSRYLLNKDGRRFFIPMTELVKPQAPTTVVTNYVVVVGTFNVQVTNRAAGSTMYYRLSEEDEWQLTSGTIAIDSGYSHASDNVEKQYDIQLKSVLNGEESDVNEVIITVNPKVASGSISTSRTPHDNDYATAATITLTPSATKDAVSSYTVDDGPATVFTEAVIINVDSTQAAGKYKVNVTKASYTDADTVSSPLVTLNKKKFYYGMGADVLADEAAIKSLTGGGSVEKGTMEGTYDITAEETGKYIWFCGTGILSSVTSGGFAVPMQAVAVIDGYNCYRSTSAVQETGTNTFTIA